MKEELEWDASWRFRAFAFWGDKYFFYPVIDEIHIYIYVARFICMTVGDSCYHRA